MRLHATILAGLLAEPRLSAIDVRVGLAVFGFEPPNLTQLARRADVSWTAARDGCHRLAECGWLAFVTSGRRSRPVPRVPQPLQHQLAESLTNSYFLTGNKGEYLMKRYLDLAVLSESFVDNARPDFVINPLSGKPLEYDRFYRQGVAFEFNGPQHSQVVDRFNDDESLRETIARDLIKEAKSIRARVILVVITATELDPVKIDQLIPATLATRSVDREGPYYLALAGLCARYRDIVAKAQRQRAR